MLNREQLEQAIAAQEGLRQTLGDAVVDATITILQEKLAEMDHANTPEQRKLVTILFTDIVASTAISENLDPEDVLEIMDGALEAYSNAVGELGGTVARLMGDGLLAFFGAPVGREDDAVRAVRCGLAIQRATRAYGRTVEDRWGVSTFSTRVGINTGLVALGEVGGASGSEWTAMGDAINLAARLQNAAPPGGILISVDTYRQVRGLFETRTLEPIPIKGKAEPVQVYLVEREKPRTFRINTRGVEGVTTRMYGRAAELEQLKGSFAWSVEEQETQILTVIGEPGVGKSRLLREFDAWLDELPESILHFTGRATAEMLRQPYALMRNMFAFRFEIQDSDSAATVRDKLERGITGFLGPDTEARAHYIGHMIGFDFSASPYIQGEDPQQLAQLGLFHITEFFGKVAARTPTVIFLDDIHWADDKTLDLVYHIIRSRRELRLLVVCLARPALFERRTPPWMLNADFHQTIDLRPLSRDDSLGLAADILRKAEVIPEALMEVIVNTSEGNPFYLEEIVKMLLDDGVILRNGDLWTVDASRLTELKIPATLTGVLQARLDALPPAERTLLQRAAVVGRIFWDHAVMDLHADGDQPVENVAECLAALRRRELIRWREQSAFAGAEEYIFRHTILHDVTYESVLRRLRRTYHAQVAEWLIERSGDRIAEYTGLIAEHFERAGQAGRAVAFLSRAAEQALTISAYWEAIERAERALALLDEEDIPDRITQEAQIKAQLGQAHRWLSEFTRAQELYEDSLALFEQADDKKGIVRVLYELGWLVGTILRRYDEAETYFQKSLSIAETCGDRRGVSWALNGLGTVAHFEGRYTDAIASYQESLKIAREIGDQARTAGALNNLGLVKGELGRTDEARGDLEAGLQIFRTIGSRSGTASPLMNLGNLSRFQGQHEEAYRLFTEALAIYEETGDRAGLAVCLWSLGSLARVQGDYDGARRHYTESLAISREIGSPAGIGSSLEDLALVAQLQGRYDEAQMHLNEILQIARQTGDASEIANALLNLGAVARAQGQLAQAQRYLEDSVVLNMESGSRRGLARAIYSLGDVALALGQYDSARQHYIDAHAIYREFGQPLGKSLTLGGLGDVAALTGDMETARQTFYEAYNIASSVRDTPLMLWILTGVAGLLAREGQQERSLELLGLVLNHMASPQEAQDKARRILDEMSGDLTAPGLAAALERGRGMADGLKIRRLTLDEERWRTLVT